MIKSELLSSLFAKKNGQWTLFFDQSANIKDQNRTSH